MNIKNIKILLISFCILNAFSCMPLFSLNQKKLVLLSPAGDAKNTGRKLVENYERGVTLQFAEELQKEIVKEYGHKVVLTRQPGEVVLPLQNASFSNRSKADFFLSLHVYRQEDPKPKVFVYYLLYNSMVDLAQQNFNTSTFVPIYQAHYQNINRTIALANNMKNVLTDDSFTRKLSFYGPQGLPFKPLVGISAPAIAVEIGICDDRSWTHLVEPIVKSLSFLKNL